MNMPKRAVWAMLIVILSLSVANGRAVAERGSNPPGETPPDPCKYVLGGDYDDDGLDNGRECRLGTNPLKRDTDTDYMSDYDEWYWGTNPLAQHSDGDAAMDGCEFQYSWNGANVSPTATDPDSDGDTIPDGLELYSGLNPGNQDTDQDLLFDNEEWKFCVIGNKTGTWTLPILALDPDYDDDGIPDGIEKKSLGTYYFDADTDDDGYGDGTEVYTYGTDPLDPNDHPDPYAYPPDHP
jgi:hypothetical protein